MIEEFGEVWLRGLDLNQRPLGYEPNELPDCSTPQLNDNNLMDSGQTRDGALVIALTAFESRLLGFDGRIGSSLLLDPILFYAELDSC